MDSLCSIKKVCPVCKKEFNDLSRDLCGCNNSLKFKIFFKENKFHTCTSKEFNSKSEMLDYLYDSLDTFYQSNQITKECEEKAFDYLNWIKENENKDLKDIQDFIGEVKDFLNRLIITKILINLIDFNRKKVNDFIFKVNNNIFFQESYYKYSKELKEPLDDTGYIFKNNELIDKLKYGLKIDVSELYYDVKEILSLANYYGTLSQKENISKLNEFVQTYDSYRSKLNTFLLKEVSIEKWDDFRKSSYFDSIKMDSLKKEFTQSYFKILLNNVTGTEELSENNLKFIKEFEGLYFNIKKINKEYLSNFISSCFSKTEINNYLNSFSKVLSQDEKENIKTEFKWFIIKSNLINIELDNNDLVFPKDKFYLAYYTFCSDYSFDLFVDEINKINKVKDDLITIISDKLNLNKEEILKSISMVYDLVNCDEPSFYFDYDKQNKFKREHEVLFSKISSIRNILDSEGFIQDDKDPFYFYKLLNFDKFFKEWNNNYVQNELWDNKDYFDEMGLNDEQREAVIRSPNVLRVIAGAGSGKTSTIVAKVKYLIDIKKVSPEKIVCISYTNDAVDNLKRRIGNDGVFISTIHKFAKTVAGFSRYFNKSINFIFNHYVEDILKNDKSKIKKLVEYFSYYLREPPIDVRLENDANDNLGEKIKTLKSLYFSDYRKNSYNTFNKAEEVKSLGELIIANYLYIHQIRYKYEPVFPFSKIEKEKNITPDRNKFDNSKAYHPDFYLPDYDIYLEHFGLDGDYRAPWLNESHENDYINERKWKLDLFKEYDISYIETFSYYVRDNILVSKLEAKLKEKGVEIKQDYDKIFNELLENSKSYYKFKLFNDLVSNFLSIFKSRGFVKTDFSKFFKEVDAKSENNFQRNRFILFLEIMEDFYSYYESMKDFYFKDSIESKGIDFQDGIVEATKKLNNECCCDYDYVIIDEFQDANPIIFDLLTAFHNKKCNIMLVEDDWQSIFRYAGSEVNLSDKFAEEEYGLETVLLENNYRNPQSLIDVSSKFIKKNSLQSDKMLNSKTTDVNGPLRIVYLNSPLKYEDKPNIKNKPKINIRDAFKYYVDKISEFSNEIMVLGRYKHSCDFVKRMVEFEVESIMNSNGQIADNKYIIHYLKRADLKIQFFTVHAAKGLEAENVIILDLKDDVKAFPNKIEEDSVLSFITPKKEEHIYAEERRLFYVALTRTKNRCYLISDYGNASTFISELEGTKYLVDETPNLEEFIINSKKDKNMLIKSNAQNSSNSTKNNGSKKDFWKPQLDKYPTKKNEEKIYETNIDCPRCKENPHSYGKIVINKRRANNGEYYTFNCSNRCGWKTGSFTKYYEKDSYKLCPKCKNGIVHLNRNGDGYSCSNKGCNYTEKLNS
ncbi:MAG: UvrD-helicase domain-containing protein [Methanobrevibacter woesei]|uniref:UvrD-helicase domain-containing protein n=1 Tax=Methanobrevibacter woesei TaxID=190976 RepID=UPI0023F5613F|nr:UvrD-helicase domain-containing protein [Methanobrevibacter woesei]MCI7292124.1 UvrD-helicase domain-containing protein [Methanobrevibacter woesei]